ncbi:6666_t:CDS:2 [Diversispora eburnea]|uniref:6666_t:CDS:1 n=1 Tax=Diversispora eburnea TaxID=1213867 RepID=A0A9N8Z4E1_9GLOM|nr:6666_t:CDS:2 [Diversispora eburnea]
MTNFIREKVFFSKHKLTFDNDIRSNSNANINRPKVWAMTCQELCETVPYFKSWNGGIYYKNGVVWGYLLDGFGALRDPEYEYYCIPADEGKIKNEENVIEAVLSINRENFSEKNHEENQMKSELISIVCPECGLLSNKIYEDLWICLNHNCKHFWKSLSVDFIWEDVPENLDYVKSFLSPGLLDTNQRIQIPFSILPPQPQNDSFINLLTYNIGRV